MKSKIQIREFGKLHDGSVVREFTIININGFSVSIIEFGAIIRTIKYPGNDLHNDVVLGFDTLEEYIDDKYYIGCIIGRVANRIKNGEVQIKGFKYKINTNLGNHTLHGGIKGWDKKVWVGKAIESNIGMGVELYLVSPDGDEGFPGNVTATVSYILTDENELIIDYSASSDLPTLINMTQHSYFNLSGHADHKIGEHFIKINAAKIYETDSDKIPTGKLISVCDLNLCLQDAQKLGDIIEQDKEGIDHYFVGNVVQTDEPIAILMDNKTNRRLEVFTDALGLQVYTGQFLPDFVGKNSIISGEFSGICLETQNLPYTNSNDNIGITFDSGEKYQQKTIWKFS